MGYAGIARNRDSVTVKIAPARLKLTTYAKLTQLLTDADPRRVSLSWHGAGWAHELLPGSEAALARISKLLFSARNDGGPKKYSSEPRALDTLERNHPFTALLDAWRETSGDVNLQNYPQIVCSQLESRFAVIKHDLENGLLLFDQIGDGHHIYRKGWTSALAGSPVEDQPDMIYGTAVANDWRGAFIGGVPTLSDIDAIVDQPAQEQIYRGRYSRLTLPLTGSAEKRLLSASFPDTRIDLLDSSHHV